MLDIRVVTTPEELHAIYRLRYQVYVEEIGARMEYANHQTKELCEPWDATGENIGAWLDGQLVGCVRFNSAATTDFSAYEHLFHLRELQRFMACSPADFSLSTKLAVVKTHRRVKLTALLCQACYAVMRAEEAALNFLICQTKLVPFYQKFGFQVCGASFFHPEGGAEVPMVIVTQDQAHLQRVQSPFQYPSDQKRATRLSQFYASVATSNDFSSAQPFGGKCQEFKIQLVAGLNSQPEG